MRSLQQNSVEGMACINFIRKSFHKSLDQSRSHEDYSKIILKCGSTKLGKKNVMWSKGCGIAVFKVKSCESWWITQQTSQLKGLNLMKCHISKKVIAVNAAIMFIHKGCFTDPSVPQTQARSRVQKSTWCNTSFTIKHF